MMTHFEIDGSVVLIRSDGQTQIVPAGWTNSSLKAASDIFLGPNEVPETISMLQARIALRRAGKLADVEAAVSAAGGEIQDYWEYTTQLHRDHPVVEALASAVGLTSSQVDDLFRLAITIT